MLHISIPLFIQLPVNLIVVDFTALKIIRYTIEPVKILAELICKRNLEFSDVATVFSFLFGELENIESNFALKMVQSL